MTVSSSCSTGHATPVCHFIDGVLEINRRRCGKVRPVTTEPMQVVLETSEQLQDSGGPFNLQSYLHAYWRVVGHRVEHAWMGVGAHWVHEASGVRERTGADQLQNRRRVTADSAPLFGAFHWLISQIRSISLNESLMRLDAMLMPSWDSNLHDMWRHCTTSSYALRFKLLSDRSAWTGWIYSECILLLFNTWHNQFGFKFHFAAITVKQDTTWPRHQTNSETRDHCGLWLTVAKMWELAHTKACAPTHVRLTQPGKKLTGFYNFTLLFLSLHHFTICCNSLLIFTQVWRWNQILFFTHSGSLLGRSIGRLWKWN